MFAGPDGGSGGGAPGVREMGDDPPDSFSEACGLAGPAQGPARGPRAAGPVGVRVPPPVPPGRPRRSRTSRSTRRRSADATPTSRSSPAGSSASTSAAGPGSAGTTASGPWAGSTGDGASRSARPGSASNEGDEPARRVRGAACRSPGRSSGPRSPMPGWNSSGRSPGREPWQVSRALVLLGRSPTCRVRLDGARGRRDPRRPRPDAGRDLGGRPPGAGVGCASGAR